MNQYMAERFFALGLSEHRLWGLVLIPLMLIKKEEESYSRPDYTVFPDESDESFLSLSHTEKEAVRIIDEYSDQKLFKYFSKHKSVKEFQEKVSEERISQFIRPYIEKRIVRVLQMILGTRVKIFLRDKSRSNIFDEDFLTIRSSQAEPVFNFLRGEDGSRYSLDLYYENKKLKLRDQYTDILSNSPAVIRINNKIFFIRDIEGTKIRPFFTKDFINIPQKAEIHYFKTFGLNIIRNYEVNAEGFTVNKKEVERSARITLEKGIHNNAVITLGSNMVIARSLPIIISTFLLIFTRRETASVSKNMKGIANLKKSFMIF